MTLCHGISRHQYVFYIRFAVSNDDQLLLTAHLILGPILPSWDP